MKRSPREVTWRVLTFGPAVTVVVLGLVLLLASGWAEGWHIAFAYAMAGLNMWLVARSLRTTYRSGYWTGRMELQMEQLGLKPRRRIGVDDQPEPWDDPMGPAEAIAMRQAMENLTRERGPE